MGIQLGPPVRWRRVVGVALRVALGLVALIAVAVGAALIVAHTDWGREQIRVRLERGLDDAFVGDVRLGRLEGSVLHDATIRGIEIEDASGEPAVTAGALRVEFDLLPLLWREVQLDRITIEDLVVAARERDDGTLNLAHMMKPREQRESSWDLALDDLVVVGAAVSLDRRDAEDVHLDDLRIGGAIEVEASGRIAGDVALGATWRERGVQVALDARAVRTAEALTVDSATAALGGVSLIARGVEVAGDEVRGQATLVAPAEAVRRLVPSSPLLADVRLVVRADPVATAKAATRIDVVGSAGRADLRADLVLAPEARRLRGTVRVDGVDAAAIVRGAIPTALDARLELDVVQRPGGQGLAAADGEVSVRAGGRIGEVAIESLRGEVALDDGRVRASLTSRHPGDARASIELRAAARRGGGVAIDEARVQARAPDLGAVVRRELPLAGSLEVDVTARGEVGGATPSLALSGTIDGRRLRYDQTRVEAALVEVHGSGLPREPAGWARAEARGVVHRGQSVGTIALLARSRDDGRVGVSVRSRPVDRDLSIDLDAVIAPGRAPGTPTVIDLGRHRIAARGVVWQGRGGRVAIGERHVEARGIRSSVAGGRLAIEGSFHRAGPRTGDLAAAVRLEALDLAKVDQSIRAVAELRKDLALRGTVDLAVEVARQRGRWSGSIEGDAAGIALRPEVTAMDASIRGRAAPGAVALQLDASALGVGEVALAIDVAAPARLDDARAWRRLERDAIRSARLRIDDLVLEKAAGLAGLSSDQLRGTLSGQLTLTPDETTAWLRARGVETPRLRSALDANLTLERGAGDVLEALLVARLERVATGTAEASFRVPARPFDVAAWRRLDLDALRGAELRVDRLVLDEERSRLLGLRQELSGTASLRIEVAAGARSARARLAVEDLIGGPILRPAVAHLTARYDGDRAQLDLHGGFERDDTVRASLELPLPYDRLARGGAAALRRTPLDGALTIERLPLAALRKAAGTGQPVAGALSLEATVGGSIGAPTGHGTALLRGVGVQGEPTLRELRVEARYQAGLIRLDARGEGAAGGTLAARAEATLGERPDLRAYLTASGFDLAPLIHLAPASAAGVGGVLDASIEVRGMEPETAKARGRVRLRDARLPLGASIGALRDGVVEVALTDAGALSLNARGEVGRGEVELRGEGQLDGLLPRTASFEVRAEDVTLISELQPRIDGRIEGSVRRQGEQWQLRARVRDATVDVPEERGDALHPPGPPPDMVFIEDGRPPPRLADEAAETSIEFGQRPAEPWLVATVDLAGIDVRAKELRGELRGEVRLALGRDSAALDGRIRVARGQVTLFDRRYVLSRANVRFDGPLDPVLDIELYHQFPQLTMYVSVRGRLSEPEVALRSDPGTYSEGQLLGFLLGGKPGAQTDREPRQVATNVAAGFLTKRVGEYVDDVLPVDVDVLRYEAASATSAASFTIGKWLTDELFLAYRRRLETRPEQNSGEAELEYWFNRNVLVEAIAGDRGVHGIDLLWIRRW